MTDLKEKQVLLEQQKRALLKIRALKKQVAKLESEKTEKGISRAPVAVIGMSCRLPGGIDSPEIFWEKLTAGEDCIGPIPTTRFAIEQYYSDDPSASGKMYVREGGFMTDIDQFDADLFGINTREADSMDPQQRLLLENTYSALQHAQLDSDELKGSATGIFMGVCTQDYSRYSLNSQTPENIDIYSFTGNAPSIAGGRISNILDFKGPNITVDTACSSSLVAVHLAVQSLRNGESDLAFAGGVNVILSPANFVYFCKVNALSPDARCKTFDESANGYVRSEGCGVVALKLLDQAMNDGDPIIGIVRSSVINQDGRSFDLTAPNGTAQRELIQRALDDAGLKATDISYVESHGTGTPLGDPIEVGAINAVYGKNRDGDKPLVIGALKSVIGHTEAASGIAGFIKAMLCMQRSCIPGNLHFSTPNNKINWQNLNISIPKRLQNWPDYVDVKRVGVSAFGFSGTNAHLILEQAPEQAKNSKPMTEVLFNRKPHWLRSIQGSIVESRSEWLHPFMQAELNIVNYPNRVFQSTIDLDSFAYLRSHPVWGKIIVPGAVYVEMAVAAAHIQFEKYLTGANIELTEFLYHETFEVKEQGSNMLQGVLENITAQSCNFAVYSLDKNLADNSKWQLHAQGKINLISDTEQPRQVLDRRSVLARCQQPINSEEFYRRLDADGYYYGKDHRGVAKAWLGEGEIIAKIMFPPSLLEITSERQLLDDYYYHPAITDSAFQLLLALLPKVGDNETFVTLGKEKIDIYGPCQGTMWVHTQKQSQTESNNTIVRGDVRIYDEEGKLIAETLGYMMKRTSKRQQVAMPAPGSHSSYSIKWVQQVGNTVLKPSQVLLIAYTNDTEHLRILEQSFSEAGVKCHSEFLASGNTGYLEAILNRILQKPNEISDLYFCPGRQQSSLNILEFLLDLIKTLHSRGAINRQRINLMTCCSAAINEELGVTDFNHAGIDGFVRTLWQELPLAKLRLIDVDHQFAKQKDIAAKLLSSQDGFIALRGDKLWRAQLSIESLLDIKRMVKKLGIVQRGELSSLKWQDKVNPVLGDRQVAIDVQACGLNLRDVFDALGLHPRQFDEWGLECAGTVVEIGKDVSEFSVGDQVIAFGTGCMASTYYANCERVALLPLGLTAVQGATIPIAFLTAYYGLIDQADLKSGDKVLIHAAAGGVGMAAVQLAMLQGAEVYASASKNKWETLKDMGVQHIFDSRRLDFANQIKQLTNGNGVDVVFNSLSDDFISASVDVLAKKGRFVEIGLNGWSLEQMEHHRNDVNYFIINLMAKWEKDPKAVKVMLDDIISCFEKTRPLAPLPTRTFSQIDTQAAFKIMQQGKHIGKIIIEPKVVEQKDKYDISGTVVISGGRGAIGLKLLPYLFHKGHRKFATLGRNQVSERVLKTISAMGLDGVNIRHYCTDISISESLTETLAKIRKQLGAITAVYHCAGITHDALITEMETTQLSQVWKPKVEGAWLLHQLTEEDPIDQFVLFSSMSSLLGAEGAANYAAANSALNALCDYRQQRGQAAVSIAWGPWEGDGMFQELDEKLHKMFTDVGISPYTDAENLTLLERVLAHGKGTHGVFAIDWPAWLKEKSSQALLDYLQDFSSLQMNDDAKKTESSLSQAQYKLSDTYVKTKVHSRILRQLASCDSRDSTQISKVLKSFVQLEVAEVLNIPESENISGDMGFFDLGMNSLTSIELRNRLQGQLELELPTTLTFDYSCVDTLVEYLVKVILKQGLAIEKQSQNTLEQKVSDLAPDCAQMIEQIKSMSEQDVLNALMEG